jgi:membrane protein DedA with SNARE-associated domain
MFNGLIDWYRSELSVYGYPLVGLLMAIESSLVPLPSEAVIPFAAHMAHTGQIQLTLPGIVIAGTIGSWIGATAMYWVSRVAGRPLVIRYGRWAMITPEKVEGAERFASHYGSVGIFISRLLPVVRHLIGIPAGIVRMDYRWFSLFTVAGSAVWCMVLCWVGIAAGEDKQLVKGDMRHITLWLGGGMIVLGAIYYVFVHRHMKAEKPAAK